MEKNIKINKCLGRAGFRETQLSTSNTPSSQGTSALVPEGGAGWYAMVPTAADTCMNIINLIKHMETLSPENYKMLLKERSQLMRKFTMDMNQRLKCQKDIESLQFDI